MIVLCCLSPFIMGVKNLDAYKTATILELFVSILGIIMLIPVFTPETAQDIRELVQSKKESTLVVHILRYIEALLILCLTVALYMVFLKRMNCVFPFGKMLYGALANCIFLGGLGLFCYALFDHLIIAYMVPVLYYVSSYGGGIKFLKQFYLFGMTRGNFTEKSYLMIAGILFTIFALLFEEHLQS